MTEKKIVAHSVKSILEHPIIVSALNRNSDILQHVSEVQNWWGYDLLNRKPSPAYDEYGIFQGTNLDLACFLYSLTDRGAVINIPEYTSHSKTKIREDQQLLSKYNRHGRLIGVGANKNFFSFNISIIDENVIGEDKVGDFRTFSLTDKSGNWYDGWKRIEFTPTLKENKFLTENKLWSGNTIHFKNFIHPNRWTSVFGQYYLITRIVMGRLEDEAAFLNQEVKRLQAAGINFPPGSGPQSFETTYGKSVQQKFTAFEMDIFIPDVSITGTYTSLPETQTALVEAYRKRKEMTYKILPKLRFMTRASEFAHFQNPDRFPAWIKNVSWENNFKLPKGRTLYQRLKLFQDKVGQQSISLIKRVYEKSATVAA